MTFLESVLFLMVLCLDEPSMWTAGVVNVSHVTCRTKPKNPILDKIPLDWNQGANQESQ